MLFVPAFEGLEKSLDGILQFSSLTEFFCRIRDWYDFTIYDIYLGEPLSEKRWFPIYAHIRGVRFFPMIGYAVFNTSYDELKKEYLE